ncbi:MAG: hypothetical protein KF774_04975 [Planctomyces sp.]|nr:hypothetical protein [Planctomyces sp.]
MLRKSALCSILAGLVVLGASTAQAGLFFNRARSCPPGYRTYAPGYTYSSGYRSTSGYRYSSGYQGGDVVGGTGDVIYSAPSGGGVSSRSGTSAPRWALPKTDPNKMRTR